MEHKKHEAMEDLGQVHLGRGESCSSSHGDSTSSDNRVQPDNEIVSNSSETVSAGRDSAVLDVNMDRLWSSKKATNLDGQEIGKPSNEGTSGTSGVACNEFAILVNSEEIVSAKGQTQSLESNLQGSGSNGGVANEETHSSDAVNQVVIVINIQEDLDTSGRNGQLEVPGKESGFSEATLEESKTKAPKEEKPSSVVDVKGGGGGRWFKDDRDGENVCRICHLSSDGLHDSTASANNDTTTSMDLIHLGCGCKAELGLAHAECAEAWFKLKGNRICEICGATATNIASIRDNRFFERRSTGITSGGNGPSEGGGRYWRGQPFCNLLMALMVIIFVLPWFFRVNMF